MAHGLNLVILNLLALMIESTWLMTISMEMVCIPGENLSRIFKDLTRSS